MPSFTTTPNLGITELTGSQSNKATTVATSQEEFDEAIAGTYSLVTTAGGTFTLSSLTDALGYPSWINAIIALTGTPGAGVTVVFPKSPTLPGTKLYLIYNNCGQTATIECSGQGSPPTLVNGSFQFFYDNGTIIVPCAPTIAGSGSVPVPVDIGVFYAGKPAASGYLYVTVLRTITFPANFSSANGAASAQINFSSNPTVSSYVITVSKLHSGSTTAIGTITVTSGGGITFATTGGTAQTLAAGDQLEFLFPVSQDVTFADPAITLGGTR